MEKSELVKRLREKRIRLLKAYLFHVLWLFSTTASAAVDAVQVGLPILVLLTLVTVPPVLYYTVVVHKACMAVNPSSRSAGLLAVVVFTVLFTPLESGLVLPLKNLWVSKCILNAWDKTLTKKDKDRLLCGWEGLHTTARHRSKHD